MSDIEIGSVWQGKNNEGDVLIVWANQDRVHYDYLNSLRKPVGNVYDTSITHFLEYFEPKTETIDEFCDRKNQELKDDMSTIYDQPTSAPPQADMASKQDKTVTALECLVCSSQFPIDSAQAVAIDQGEGCPTCQLELIAENCSPSRLSEIIKGKLNLSFDKKVFGAMPYIPAPQDAGKMKLIGIAGQARSGKDTLASYLLNNLSNDWTRSSFADPIKNMLNVIGVDCSDESKAVVSNDYGVTPRHMMQTLGTEWGRNLIDNDIWVKAFARLNAGMCVIVPDVRFENEADLVRQHGVLIHLTGRGGIAGNHVSENPIGFKEGDIVIDNSRDLAWLYAQVDNNAVLSKFLVEVSE